MRREDVTFKYVDAEIEDVTTGEDRRTMEAIEIKMPDGSVRAFPADAVNDESGRRYCDLFAAKYQAFKNGDPDPDRVSQLEREIEERQNELKALREKPAGDKRVQENLGYGKQPDPDSARAAAGHERRHRDDGGHQGVMANESAALGQHSDQDVAGPNFDGMSDTKLRKWIADNGGEEQRSNASHESLVKAAQDIHVKAVRKRARAERAASE
jgi:hypothetical protein